jgi:hypothetical protein
MAGKKTLIARRSSMETSAGSAMPVQQSLRDMVLGMLSVAAVKGTTRVPLTDFFGAFEAVVEAHPDRFPPMHFTRNACSVYSKRLDDAVQSFVGGSIELPNPSLQFLEIKQDAARRHIAWLSDKYSTDIASNLEPLTEEFLTSVQRRAKVK